MREGEGGREVEQKEVEGGGVVEETGKGAEAEMKKAKSEIGSCNNYTLCRGQWLTQC